MQPKKRRDRLQADVPEEKQRKLKAKLALQGSNITKWLNEQIDRFLGASQQPNQ